MFWHSKLQGYEVVVSLLGHACNVDPSRSEAQHEDQGQVTELQALIQSRDAELAEARSLHDQVRVTI